MAARDLEGAPFKIGDYVVIREPNIRPWGGEVWSCKPTKVSGWWVGFLRDGCEVVVHESLVHRS